MTEYLILNHEFRCLSTLHPNWVMYAERNWPSPEHAIIAARCQNTVGWEKYWAEIARIKTPEQARRWGKRLPVRKDWPQVRDQVLEQVMGTVLSTYPGLRVKLKATGTNFLLNVEDTEFGCELEPLTMTITGKNRLGVWLMKYRTNL